MLDWTSVECLSWGTDLGKDGELEGGIGRMPFLQVDVMPMCNKRGQRRLLGKGRGGDVVEGEREGGRGRGREEGDDESLFVLVWQADQSIMTMQGKGRGPLKRSACFPTCNKRSDSALGSLSLLGDLA